MGSSRSSSKTSPATGSDDAAASGAASSAGYTVLARRYRSRDFDELVGQEPIARTLQAAIERGRTAHAYLFCGTRGVGKTSMARIFAKALNADEAQTEGGAIGDAVLRGEDLDVIEIDGASNRGIAEARDLIAGAGLSPARGRYKIYIIDEVHMLTREAFNALLKTMEEPPPHVKFILCTTDPQKVPATIQSRCQRFDFRAIPTARIAAHLQDVLGREGVQADEDVVLSVASLGNGSMRDALSLLDRLLAANADALTMDVAREVLGLPATEVIDSMVQAVIDADPAAGLAAGAELIAGGATVESALEMLTDRFRTLMLVAACGEDTDLLDIAGEARRRAAEQAAHFDAAGLVYMIATCDAVARNARGSATGRALFDAAIVRLCLGSRFGDVARLAAGGVATDGEKKNGARIEVKPAAGSPPASGSPPAPAPAPAPARRPATAPPPPASVAAALPPPATDTPVFDDLPSAWRHLAATAGGPLSAVLSSLEPVRLEDREVVLSPRGGVPRGGIGFLERRAEGLREPLSRALGRPIRIRILATAEDPAGRGPTAPAGSGSATSAAEPASSSTGGSGGSGSSSGGLAVGGPPDPGALEQAARLPLVREAMSIFDASITEVRASPAAGDRS